MSVSIVKALILFLKYIVNGILIGLIYFFISKKKASMESIFMIGISAAAIMALFDLFNEPLMVLATKFGVGFGAGSALVAGAML